MNPKVMETFYKPNKQLLKLKVELMHPNYGLVICMYHLKRKINTLVLSQAFVESKMIPLDEHQQLLSELRNNQPLLDEVKVIAEQFVDKEPVIIEEQFLKVTGALSKLTLDYLFVLKAISVYTKELKRMGPNLSTVVEKEEVTHNMYIAVKFKELKDEYELKVLYRSREDYQVQLTNSNRNKKSLPIRAYLDEDACKGIMLALRKKVDFLH